VSRFRYLTKLELTTWIARSGQEHAAADGCTMVAPTGELVARPGLHPALSDMLIQAAQEVHGRATLLQRAGEFPAPTGARVPGGRETPRAITPRARASPTGTSPSGSRASVDRIAIVLLPLAVILIPGAKIVPWLYRWRVNARIYRRYGELMALERVAFGQTTPEQRAELLKRLDQIERRIITGRTPASVADQLYVLRQHIQFVRNQIAQSAAAPGADTRQATQQVRLVAERTRGCSA